MLPRTAPAALLVLGSLFLAACSTAVDAPADSTQEAVTKWTVIEFKMVRSGESGRDYPACGKSTVDGTKSEAMSRAKVELINGCYAVDGTVTGAAQISYTNCDEPDGCYALRCYAEATAMCRLDVTESGFGKECYLNNRESIRSGTMTHKEAVKFCKGKK
jgi:hypothetical protein